MDGAEVKKILDRKYLNSLSGQISHRYRHYKKELDMSNDMLFSLTYMASISTANVSRDRIFESISEKKEYYPSIYFSNVNDLAQNWHYDYASACELVSRKVTNEKLKELFNRFSNSIAAGEADIDILRKEWTLYKTKRKDEFERQLETTKEWSDAYTALLVSTSLISIIVLLSVIIYNIGNATKTLYGTAFITFLIAFSGVWLLFKGVPIDSIVHNLKIKSKEQLFVHKWLRVTIFFAAMSVILLSLVPAFLFPVDLRIDIKGVGMIIAGLIMVPVGIMAHRDITKVSKRDENYATFIQSLGSIASGSGLTIPQALKKIDPKNLGELKDMSQELYKKLASGLDPHLSWNRFVGESGSYLIYKLTSVFVDSVDLGGDAETVGEIVSLSCLEIVLLRMKRDRISSSFTYLVVPLHAAMVALLLFIGQILTNFTTLIGDLFEQFEISGEELSSSIPGGMAGMNLGIFGGVPIELLSQYVVVVIIILTLANIFAVNIVKGGPGYLMIFYGAIFFTLSGIMMITVPPIVNMIFSFDTVFIGGP